MSRNVFELKGNGFLHNNDVWDYCCGWQVAMLFMLRCQLLFKEEYQMYSLKHQT